jgi:hypothetical protein
MRQKITHLPYLLFFLISFLVYFAFYKYSLADSTGSVGATVKISICGNLVAEGGEECDNLDLKGNTCESLGYVYGDLSCDIACDYNVSGCVAPTSTPTPTVTPTPTAASKSTVTTTPGATSTPAPSPTVIPTPTPILPPVVQAFDFDGSGKIEVKEVYRAVKTWVEEWRETVKRMTADPDASAEESMVKKCDINQDRECNLLDFSILLYYIGK